MIHFIGLILVKNDLNYKIMKIIFDRKWFKIRRLLSLTHQTELKSIFIVLKRITNTYLGNGDGRDTNPVFVYNYYYSLVCFKTIGP